MISVASRVQKTAQQNVALGSYTPEQLANSPGLFIVITQFIYCQSVRMLGHSPKSERHPFSRTRPFMRATGCSRRCPLLLPHLVRRARARGRARCLRPTSRALLGPAPRKVNVKRIHKRSSRIECEHAADEEYNRQRKSADHRLEPGH